ncbi:MAG: hypothetical protein ACREP6_05045 [Candidatus Binataceae bacterium]
MAICLLAGAIGLCGCPALIIPSLAYQGYKYEHRPAPAKNQSANSQNSRKSQPKSSEGDHSIA